MEDAEKELKPEANKLKITMFEFLHLKIDCDVLVSCNICGYDQDKSLKKLGARAVKYVDETIGADIEVLEARLKTIDEQKEKEEAVQDFGGSYSEDTVKLIKEYNDLYEKAWGTEGEIEFDTIIVNTKREDGRKFNSGIPTQKTIGFRKKMYQKNPYEIFMDFEIEKQIIVTTK